MLVKLLKTSFYQHLILIFYILHSRGLKRPGRYLSLLLLIILVIKVVPVILSHYGLDKSLYSLFLGLWVLRKVLAILLATYVSYRLSFLNRNVMGDKSEITWQDVCDHWNNTLLPYMNKKYHNPPLVISDLAQEHKDSTERPSNQPIVGWLGSRVPLASSSLFYLGDRTGFARPEQQIIINKVQGC